MAKLNRRLPGVPTHQFSMVPRPDVPRSTFRSTATYKTTFDADTLVPFFVEEVLPGDVWKGRGHVFIRMSTPVFPIMDNIDVDFFFFFVPNRLVWKNWQKFMGEQETPNASTDYLIPVTTPQLASFTPGSMLDYLGIGGVYTRQKSFNALPFRGVNLIFNEWFRDENLVNPSVVHTDDGPDDYETSYALRKRGKRHDYFTSALPWPQKGPAVGLPLGGLAPVIGIGTNVPPNASLNQQVNEADGSQPTYAAGWDLTLQKFYVESVSAQAPYLPNIFADLSQATGATINAMRIAVATQQLLERDARGGTRYTELLRNHFGVLPQDARLQRPEYCGGGTIQLHTQAIPQTSGTANDPDTGYSPTPIGSLGGASTANGQISFGYAATEHGYLHGLMNARADLTYQQGVHRMWTRRTKHDFYWPAYAFLGEQIVRQDEIYATGEASDDAPFAYQERWSEYRYRVSLITGKFKSGISGTLDAWHLSQAFGSAPALNSQFIEPDTPMSRVLAAGNQAAEQEFLMDSVWNLSRTCALPVRSVPGLTRF